MSRQRCAIYTRKSTDEGLDQDFNSLDAQREACEAFIASQRQEGWVGIATRYDDGGYSGGTLERPAVQRLLADIKAGVIDTVVVYKIDRLTRSLADFARMVEVFDTHGVSFVAVTQQFNTTTSMGRLTLNVLLSFAQFEREVTAERIRDKITASKKKGMWMGGLPPLGYDVVDRRLILNQQEAEVVRQLFGLYLDLGSVRAVKSQADRIGLRTKVRTTSDGGISGGGPFSRGHLYRLLANPLYIGKVRHHDALYDGQHDAIVERATWEAVQAQLSDHGGAKSHDGQRAHESLLTGIAFDDTGDRLSPTHASKGGKRYCYYISHRMMTGSGKDGWRLPARVLETAVVDALIGLLGNRQRLIDALDLTSLAPTGLDAILKRAADVAQKIPTCGIERRREIVGGVIERIDITTAQLRMRITSTGLSDLLSVGRNRTSNGAIDLNVPFTMRRRGVEGRLVVHGTDSSISSPDPRLIALIARGQEWFRKLSGGEMRSVNDIAERENVDAADVSRIVSLAFIAPDIAKAIVEGRQPVELTANRLKQSLPLPMAWDEQRRALGFPAEPA